MKTKSLMKKTNRGRKLLLLSIILTTILNLEQSRAFADGPETTHGPCSAITSPGVVRLASIDQMTLTSRGYTLSGPRLMVSASASPDLFVDLNSGVIEIPMSGPVNPALKQCIELAKFAFSSRLGFNLKPLAQGGVTIQGANQIYMVPMNLSPTACYAIPSATLAFSCEVGR
jgi:hypothetical protein